MAVSKREIAPDALELLRALEQSVRLQSHYALLLNTRDGGRRLTFANAAAWVERLRGLERLGIDIELDGCRRRTL